MTDIFLEKQEVTTIRHCRSLLSLREIEDLTGFGFKRIKKNIGHIEPKKIEGTIHYYDPKEVFPLLYSNAEKKENILQLDQERAKLASRQAERTEIIIQQMRGELVETASLSEALNKTFGYIRSKFLSLPSKTAMLLVGLTPNEIEMVLKDNICDVLEELSNCDIREIQRYPVADGRDQYLDFEATA